ncbi:sensor histidine kinase [Terrisporobacter petrolearius]|uniref:sensor histidine kinase n=1 Tax=Terrisporobacter petrolearius TaxID=1460447 RepID=UPI003B007979
MTMLEGKLTHQDIKYTGNENKILMYVILCILLSTTLILRVIFKYNIDYNYLELSLQLIKLLNSIISILGISSCLISYNSTKDVDIFTISLMYISLYFSVIFGQMDYIPFHYNELGKMPYIMVSTSSLRIFLLTLSILPQNKLKNIVVNNKVISILINILLTITLGLLEKKLVMANIIVYNDNFIILCNILLMLVYTICSIILFIKGLKNRECVFIILSSSIFILGVKAAYALYVSSNVTFYTKLVTVSLTYICFFIIIIGSLIELLMYIHKTNKLNDDLNLFYSLSENNNHSFILIFDENRKLLYANDKVKKYYSNNNLDKLSLTFKQKTSNIKKMDEIIESLEFNGYWRGIITNEDNDKTIDCCAQLIYTAKNKKNIAITYIDITEVLKTELEVKTLKLQDKEKTEFIANISHELKTPLNIFYSSVQLLDKFIENEKMDFKHIYKKYNKVLHTNCERMTRLVNNIMDLSNISIGLLKANFKNYDIVSIVEDVTLSIVEYASFKNINIQFDTNEEEQIIKCDAYMIERVMLNLLSNSIKFSDNNSNIYVNLYIQEDWIEIKVKDEGIGIPKEYQNIIFDKFVQIDKSFTRANEGSGAGLSIVKSIIDLHKGSIKVISKSKEGTTFKVLIPNKYIHNNESSVYTIDDYRIRLELSDIYGINM